MRLKINYFLFLVASSFTVEPLIWLLITDVNFKMSQTIDSRYTLLSRSTNQLKKINFEIDLILFN